MATNLELPFEIHSLIAYFAFESENDETIRRNRLALCGVCRTMRTFHQAALYSSVHLSRSASPIIAGNSFIYPRYDESVTLFIKTVSSSQQLAGLVTSLGLSGASLMPFPEGKLAQLPQYLPRVTNLSLASNAPEIWERVVDQAFLEAAAATWDIQRLKLVGFDYLPHMLVMGMWKNLQHLTWDSIILSPPPFQSRESKLGEVTQRRFKFTRTKKAHKSMDVKAPNSRPSFVSIHLAEREVKGFAPDDFTLSTLLSFHSNHVTHLYLGGPRFATRWDRPSIDLSSFIALQRLGKEVQYMDVIDFEVEWLGQILKSGASRSTHALQVLALECKNSYREDQFVPHLLFPLSQNERDLAFSSLEREVKRLDLKIHVFTAGVSHNTHKDFVSLWEKYFTQSWKSGRLAICRIPRRMASEDHVEGVFWTDEAIQSRNELAKSYYAPV